MCVCVCIVIGDNGFVMEIVRCKHVFALDQQKCGGFMYTKVQGLLGTSPMCLLFLYCGHVCTFVVSRVDTC